MISRMPVHLVFDLIYLASLAYLMNEMTILSLF